MKGLNVRDLSKSFGINEILKDINFSISKGDKVGLIGANGSGKTTLLNLLASEDDLYSGEIEIKENIKIGYLKQNHNLDSNKNLYDFMLDAFKDVFELKERLKEVEKLMENYQDQESLNRDVEKFNKLLEEFEESGGYSYKSQIKGMLKGMGFREEDFDKKVNMLSGGEKSRLGLGKILLSKPHILLLDEPTNHLDISAIDFLEGYLRDFNGALIVISHDRYFLDNVVNRIFLLENMGLNIYDTNYTEFMRRRKKDLEVKKAQYENQQREIERQREIIERLKNLGGSKRKRGISQSRSRQKLLDKMVLVEKPFNSKNQMNLKFTPKYESGEDVLGVRNLTKSFSDRVLFEDISFDIYKREKVSLIGGNGTGKTSLFKIILKELKEDEGIVEKGDSVKISYFDQEQDNLDPENTVIDELWDSYPKLDHYDVRSYLAKFNFFGDDLFKFIKDLSGGEKSRIALLKLMLSDANFLLMDEPTNHLDIESKEVLEDALKSYEGTLFVISHDRYFLNAISEKTLVLENKSLVEYLGNYDYYKRKLAQSLEEDEEESNITKTQIKKEYKKEKKNKKEIRKAKNEIRKLEERIEKKEGLLEELKEKAYDSSLYEDHVKALDHHKKIEDLKEEIDSLSNKWIEMIESFEDE